MSWITAPFAWLLKALYDLTGSYGWAVVLFGVVVNLILLPFMAKSKKSMMRTSRLQPRITELQRRHEGNQQKLNEEMAKLYREEKINPMSGCLWSLIPFPDPDRALQRHPSAADEDDGPWRGSSHAADRLGHDQCGLCRTGEIRLSGRSRSPT